MSAIIHIGFPKFYRYGGWTFEWSRNKPFGPWPVKQDLEPRKRCGDKFYRDTAPFFKLSAEGQERCRADMSAHGR